MSQPPQVRDAPGRVTRPRPARCPPARSRRSWASRSRSCSSQPVQPRLLVGRGRSFRLAGSCRPARSGRSPSRSGSARAAASRARARIAAAQSVAIHLRPAARCLKDRGGIVHARRHETSKAGGAQRPWPAHAAGRPGGAQPACARRRGPTRRSSVSATSGRSERHPTISLLDRRAADDGLAGAKLGDRRQQHDRPVHGQTFELADRPCARTRIRWRRSRRWPGREPSSC